MENLDIATFEDQIVLDISRRMKRGKECGKPILVYLRKDIEFDIKQFCRGNKSSVVNQLLRIGLDSLLDKKLTVKTEVRANAK